MNRVQTLIQLLQQQSEKKEANEMLLQTVQMLQAELVSGKENASTSQGRVVVILPVTHIVNYPVNGSTNVSTAGHLKQATPVPEKEIQVLQVDEKEIEQELEEIKRNAQAKNTMSNNARPALPFDPVEDVPTLTHQTPATPINNPKEINEAAGKSASLNDRLKEARTELSEKLTDGPIKDLKRAIGINDRFLFINELFRGDEAMYERSIKTINNFSIFAEAEYWIRRELKIKIGWTDSDPVVKQFDQLVRRRFF